MTQARAASCCHRRSPGFRTVVATARILGAAALPPAPDPIPVGILYRNPAVPCYEDLRGAGRLRTADDVRRSLEAEFDKFTVWPQAAAGA